MMYFSSNACGLYHGKSFTVFSFHIEPTFKYDQELMQIVVFPFLCAFCFHSNTGKDDLRDGLETILITCPKTSLLFGIQNDF